MKWKRFGSKTCAPTDIADFYMIPKYDALMLPLLKLIADGEDHAQRDLAEPLANHFQLTPEERSSHLPSGQTTYLRYRLG